MAQTLNQLMQVMNLDPNNPDDVNYARRVLLREEQAAPAPQQAAPAPEPMGPPEAAAPVAAPQPSRYDQEMAAERQRWEALRAQMDEAAEKEKLTRGQKVWAGIGALGDVLGSGGEQASSRYTDLIESERERMKAAREGVLGMEEERRKVGEEVRGRSDRQRNLEQQDLKDEEAAYQRERVAEARDPRSEMSSNMRNALAMRLLAAGENPAILQGKSVEDMLALVEQMDHLSDQQKAMIDAGAAEVAHGHDIDLEILKSALSREESVLDASLKQSTTLDPVSQARQEGEIERMLELEGAAAPGGPLERQLQNIDTMAQILVGEGTAEEKEGLNTGPIAQYFPTNWNVFNEDAQTFKQAAEQLVLDATDQLQGVLTDKDMEVLRETVAGMGKDEDVNYQGLMRIRQLLSGKVDEYQRLSSKYGGAEPGGLREGIPTAPGQPSPEDIVTIKKGNETRRTSRQVADQLAQYGWTIQ